jgi:nitrogen fixation/metabolism regulation signal transduction histidine kinase
MTRGSPLAGGGTTGDMGVAARRRRSAGSTIHMRLTRAFSGIALIPTILVAIFATPCR